MKSFTLVLEETRSKEFTIHAETEELARDILQAKWEAMSDSELEVVELNIYKVN